MPHRGNIQSRLGRLEEHTRGGSCPECGLPPNGHGRIAVIDEERPEGSFDGDPDERCDRCGRYLWCVIKVVYEDPEDNDAA